MRISYSLRRVYDRIALEAFKKDSKRRIRELLACEDPIRLELGSGPVKGKNGWITSDTLIGPDLMIDLHESLPFPDNTVDMLYSSHVLEHFSIHQIETILKECWRVLKPGGLVSICVPDAQIYIDAYLDPEEFDPGFFCRYEPAFTFYSTIDYLNYIAYMDGHHLHMFDEQNLIALLCATGFRDVKRREFDPELDRLERDHTSLYVQGLK